MSEVDSAMVRASIAAAGALLLSLGGAGDAHAYGLTVTPANQEIRLAPGAASTFDVNVQNAGDAPLALKMYAWDLWWEEGEYGWTAFPPGTRPRSAAFWIDASPDHVILGPHESGVVTFSINVPPDAEGGYYAAAFVQSAVADLEAQTVVAQTAARIGVTVLVEVLGTTERAFEATDVQWTLRDGQPGGRVVVFGRNAGNVHAPLTLKGVIKRADGARVGSVESDGFTQCLPEQTCAIGAAWTAGLEAGEYEFAGVVAYGAAAPAVVQRRFTVDAASATAPAAPVGADVAAPGP